MSRCVFKNHLVADWCSYCGVLSQTVGTWAVSLQVAQEFRVVSICELHAVSIYFQVDGTEYT